MTIHVEKPEHEPENTHVKMNRYLNAGIFPFTVMLVVGYNYDELCEALDRTNAFGWKEAIKEDKDRINSTAYQTMARYVSKDDEPAVEYFFIYLKNQFRFTDWDMCMLAHEVLHVCQFAMKDILNMEREYEAVAYTHTHLMTQCLKELREAYGYNKES